MSDPTMPGVLTLTVLNRLNAPGGPVGGGARLRLSDDPEAQRRFSRLIGAETAVTLLQNDAFAVVEIPVTAISQIMLYGSDRLARLSHGHTPHTAKAGVDLGLDDATVRGLHDAVRSAQAAHARAILQLMPG